MLQCRSKIGARARTLVNLQVHQLIGVVAQSLVCLHGH